MSYSTLIDIGKMATRASGFEVTMSVVGHPGLLNRMVNDPKSIDVADMEIWQSKIAVPNGAIQGIAISEIKNWDQSEQRSTEGTFNGKEMSRQGDSPFEFIYRPDKGTNGFATGETA